MVSFLHWLNRDNNYTITSTTTTTTTTTTNDNNNDNNNKTFYLYFNSTQRGFTLKIDKKCKGRGKNSARIQQCGAKE